MFKRIVRKDGSVILLLAKADTKAVTLEVLYKVGSRQENIRNNGVSHFLEHLMFKGTAKRPRTEIISRELDSVGAEYNAFTDKEHTGYYVTADSSHLPLAMEIVSDMLYNSLLDQTEMDRERGVIIEEINMYEDNPMTHIEDLFENLLYQGSSLGRSIAGPRENIRRISRQALYNYYKKYYYNGNAVIVIAGKFDQRRALALVNKYFPLSAKKSRIKNSRLPVFKQNQPLITIQNRAVEQVQMLLGFRNVASTHRDFIPSQVLSNILGGTMSSRLFIEIRERKGLCYFIRSKASGYEHISYLGVHAGLNKEKIYPALTAIKAELDKIKNQGVSSEELKKAKANIRGHLIIRLEEASAYASFLANQELLGQRIKTLEGKLKDLDKVNLARINRLAHQVINWQQANLAIIGPFSDKNKFLKILKK